MFRKSHRAHTWLVLPISDILWSHLVHFTLKIFSSTEMIHAYPTLNIKEIKKPLFAVAFFPLCSPLLSFFWLSKRFLLSRKRDARGRVCPLYKQGKDMHKRCFYCWLPKQALLTGESTNSNKTQQHLIEYSWKTKKEPFPFSLYTLCLPHSSCVSLSTFSRGDENVSWRFQRKSVNWEALSGKEHIHSNPVCSSCVCALHCLLPFPKDNHHQRWFLNLSSSQFSARSPDLCCDLSKACNIIRLCS